MQACFWGILRGGLRRIQREKKLDWRESGGRGGGEAIVVRRLFPTFYAFQNKYRNHTSLKIFRHFNDPSDSPFHSPARPPTFTHRHTS
jgi:hypothetical protein